MSKNDPLLEVNNLKTYFHLDEGIVRAVDGVSFQVQRGRTLGVLGESGCGKSVTGFSILHLVRSPGQIVGGEIFYHRRLADGQNSGRQSRSLNEETINLVTCDPFGDEMRQIRGAEIAMVFQEPMTSLDPVYTIGNQIMEAIIYHQDVSKRAARQMAIEMLSRVGLPEPESMVDNYPHQLSGGMRQRVMIAIALACRPSLLIADEPTTALDVTTEAQILELMKNLQQEMGMAIMFISHDLGVIAEMAQDVIVMYLGKIVEQTDIQALFNDPKHPYTQALLRSIPKLGRKDKMRLDTITGMVPSPHDMPSGCPFHPRCPDFITGLCDVTQPQLMNVDGDRLVRCFLYDDPQESTPKDDGTR